MGSGVEVVVISAIVGAVGFWLGWKMRLQALMNGPAAVPSSLEAVLANPEGIEAAEERYRADVRAAAVDEAALHFTAALASRETSLRDPVALVAEGRDLAELFVKSLKSKIRAPFLR